MGYLDIGIVSVYLMVVFIIGLWAGRHIKDIKEYAVAKHSYSATFLFATLSASFIGGGFSFGNADTVFNKGIGPATALWGFSLMMILVAVFIAPRMGAFKGCISAGDILAKEFGQPARLLAGLLGCLICMGILGAQVGAMGALFDLLTPLSFIQGVFLGCGIVILYTAFGGMRAVVLTDVLQFILLVVFVPLALVMGIQYVGGWERIQSAVPNHFFDILTPDFGWFAWLSLFLSFMVGETFIPPYVQRLLIAKTPAETAKGTLWSGFLSIPFFIISGLIGAVALTIDPNMPSHLSMPMVVQVALPIGIKGLACAAIISIVMSTADSFLNAAAVCLVEDTLKPLLKRNTIFPNHPQKEVWLIQGLTLVIGFGSVFIALTISNLLDILRFSYNFWAPVLMIPLLCVLLGKKISKAAFWGGAGAGFAVILLSFSFGKLQWFGLDIVVIGVLANLIILLSTQFWKRLTFKKDNIH